MDWPGCMLLCTTRTRKKKRAATNKHSQGSLLTLDKQRKCRLH